MAKQVSLQDVLSAVGGPLEEKSLWALLYQAHDALRKGIEGVGIGREPTLLISPESMLLGYGGCVHFLPGISRSTSSFLAPELREQANHFDIQKCYVYSLGMTMLAAMQNGLKDLMFPRVSEILQKLLFSMSDEDCSHRPSLEEIFTNCSEFLESQRQAREEVDKLVSYIIGSAIEYSGSSDFTIDEADLEAEIQQAMNMKGTGSVENLYPPSYGSRASSSLSLGSTERNWFGTPKVNSQENVNIYSSLPVIFPMQHCDAGAKQNLSDDRLTKSCSQRDRTEQSLFPVERSYGSHLYTPSRRRRPIDKQIKIQNQRNPLQLQGTLFRSSSDGYKSSALHPLVTTKGVKVEHIPALSMKSDSKQSFCCSESGASAKIEIDTPETLGSDNSKPMPLDGLGTSLISPDNVHPPLTTAFPLTNSTEVCESQSEHDKSENEVKTENPSTENVETQWPLSEHQRIKSKFMDAKGETTDCSLKKLSSLLGPEFSTMSGVQTKSAPVTIDHTIPSDRRLVEVVMLNGCKVQFIVEVTSTCRDLFNQVVAHQSLEETHIFGLMAINVYGEFFLEMDRKLLKYTHKGWGSKNVSISKMFTVYFRVKYYVENVNQLRLSQTRHLYYLQLCKDILEAKTYCHEQSALKLAAYSLQAEKGDKKNINVDPYFSVGEFVSAKVISKLSEQVILSVLPGMHAELEGLNKEAAELNYLKEAQTLPEYGMVFYNVSREKRKKIGVYKGTKTPQSHWPWRKIKNLSFANQQFVIELDDQTIVKFYTDSYKKAQYLLHLCINYHRFQLLPRGVPEVSAVTNNTPISVDCQLSEDATLDGVQLPEGETFLVELIKNKDVLGLRLAGGRKKLLGGGFIYVKSINDGSIAALSGKINQEDILLEVNHQSVHGMTHREAAARILESDGVVTFRFHRPYKMQWLQDYAPLLRKDESWSDLSVTKRTTTQLNVISEEV